MEISPRPTRYEIRVRGIAGETLLLGFPALCAETKPAETLLIGVLPDQAALQGVIAQLGELGLELLEVRSVSATGADHA